MPNWVTIKKGEKLDLDSYYKVEIIERNPRSYKYKIKLSHKYLLGVSDTFGVFDYDDALNWIEENFKCLNA